jgi:Family of unknown function (DUF6519)
VLGASNPNNGFTECCCRFDSLCALIQQGANQSGVSNNFSALKQPAAALKTAPAATKVVKTTKTTPTVKKAEKAVKETTVTKKATKAAPVAKKAVKTTKAGKPGS